MLLSAELTYRSTCLDQGDSGGNREVWLPAVGLLFIGSGLVVTLSDS